MGEIVQFVGRNEATARQNLNAFVDLARHKLTAFDDGGGWNELAWRENRVSAVFCKYRPRSESRRPPVAMAEPFLTFAKAYLRYRYSHKPVRSTATLLGALRMIELALLEATNKADILDLSVPVLDLSARHCADLKASKGAQYAGGREIEAVADFCRIHGLVPALPNWKQPFKRPSDLTETLTKEGEQYRERKLPTNHQMLALAELFARAEDVEERYFTSIAALLMFAPSRISEVLALPVNCVGWEETGDGERQMYLRWRAAKRGGAMKKWVPTVMQSVVEVAVERLTTIGAAARAAARFAYENPGQFMRHPGCTTPEDFREDDELEPSQIAAAVSLGPPSKGTGRAMASFIKKKLDCDGPLTYRRLAEAAARIHKTPDWPYINDEKEVLVWDALCLARKHEYHKTQPVHLFSWQLPGAGHVNDRLGRRISLSLFERAGLRNPDGSPIKLTTHQPRHWLSTVAARAGMDDFTLAQWAGRARVEDNEHYDHRTQRERNDELRSVLLHPEEPSTLEKFRGGLPVSYREIGIDRLGATKVTLYGLCVHDYAMTPCQKQRRCMTCKEHVFIKGEHVTLARIKRHEELLVGRLDKARQAATEGVFGADRWIDDCIWELALTRTIRTMLEEGPVPDGTTVSIPADYDPSPVRRALMDRNLIEAPSIEDIPVRIVRPALEGPTVA